MGRQERRWRNGARLPSTWPTTSGEEPLTAKADQATADGVAENRERDTDSRRGTRGAAGPRRPGKASAARSCTAATSSPDATASRSASPVWTDSAVGVRSTRSCAAPSACTSCPPTTRGPAPCWPRPAPPRCSGDPRFVQVLDAVEENDLVYVVHEWLPDATELTALLAAGPAGAARRLPAGQPGLPGHGRRAPRGPGPSAADPRRRAAHVIRAVPHPRPRRERRAARHHLASTPQRTDTEAIGALLYAALTQRWPYENDAYGLSGLPKGVGLIAPDQVRAGVHRGLSELAMRALVNDGATASRQEPPCTTPEELAKAVARDAAHPPAGARLHRPAGVPAHDVPAGHATAARRQRPRRRPAGRRPRRPRCRAVPARPSSGRSPPC